MQLPATTDDLRFGADPDEEVLNQAREAGGELASEDRESGGGMTCPVYAVVGNNAQDANYTEEVNGRTRKMSRAGTFKRIKDGETSYLDSDRIMPFVILSARTGRVCFEGGKAICRGISTNGRYDEVCISQNSPVREFGEKCSRCPMNRFNPDYRDQSVTPINPRTNAPFEDNEWCKNSCDLYCAEINPGDDAAPFELVKVQFSAMGFKRWTEFARKVENRGTKLWSFWSGFKAEEVANPDSARSASYLPAFSIGGTLRPEQIEQAERLRAQLLDQLRNLTGTPPADGDAAPARMVEAPAGNHALPAYTSQDAPGEPVGAVAAAPGRKGRKTDPHTEAGDWDGPD